MGKSRPFRNGVRRYCVEIVSCSIPYRGGYATWDSDRLDHQQTDTIKAAKEFATRWAKDHPAIDETVRADIYYEWDAEGRPKMHTGIIKLGAVNWR